MCKIDKYSFQGDVVYYEYYEDESSEEDTAPAPGPASAPAPAPTGQLSTKNNSYSQRNIIGASKIINNYWYNIQLFFILGNY